MLQSVYKVCKNYMFLFSVLEGVQLWKKNWLVKVFDLYAIIDQLFKRVYNLEFALGLENLKM